MGFYGERLVVAPTGKESSCAFHLLPQRGSINMYTPVLVAQIPIYLVPVESLASLPAARRFHRTIVNLFMQTL